MTIIAPGRGAACGEGTVTAMYLGSAWALIAVCWVQVVERVMAKRGWIFFGNGLVMRLLVATDELR